MSEMQYKRCPSCCGTLPTSAYNRDSRHADGLQGYCRECCKQKALVRENRNRAAGRVYLAELTATTACAHCGSQPVEWHNPEHVELNRQNFRIGFMVSSGRTLAAIKAEIVRCTPLCRRCHMTEDGRLAAFKRNRGSRPRNENPCSSCNQPYSPLRKGLCHRCNERRRRETKKVG